MADPTPATREDLTSDPSAIGIWRHRTLLPPSRHTVTLGEGETALLPLSVSTAPPGVKIHAKLESLNPTLSFKDRGMAVASSWALDLGMRGLMLASTGNAAVSASAYAAAAGMECRIFCGTESRAHQKLAAAAAHGAQVRLVDGDYSAAYAAAVGAESDGWFNVTTTYRNPALAEAYRTIAVEIFEQLGRVPGVVIVPVGAGPLLRAVLAGFSDLVTAGLAHSVPRMIGVQALACAPLAHAWSQDNWRLALAEAVPVSPTLAGAIADSLRGYEREGLLTLSAVKESRGTVVAVDEDSILAATHELARRGLLVEPAAAAALAALGLVGVRDVISDAHESQAHDVVLLLTGHGAKEPSATPTFEVPDGKRS
ncbi:pyridoxal-phosphate dependent enzyme [Terrabacter terrigena]|uniref:Pyridoxal-phosphate dependent enzyme n=1 Tax=Terrabacter terrigena TaxID=574718 RepID=A0ABW3N132_9MICO